MTHTYDYNNTQNKASTGDPVAVPVGSAPTYNNPRSSFVPTTSSKATASLICGIIGIIILGFILGPVAIGLGVSAQQDIRNSNGHLKGEGQAVAGITCGAVALVLWIIIVCVYW